MSEASQARLNLIETRWSLVGQAHGGGIPALAARDILFHRYSGAAWRYLLAVARSQEIAEELFQEFSLRLIRGDFSRSSQERGRFRDYIKTVLINLVRDYHRKRRCQPVSLSYPLADPASDPHRASASKTTSHGTPTFAEEDPDATFLQSWRSELLHRVWKALASQKPKYHAVLTAQIELPTKEAREKAKYVEQRLGQAFTANHYRVALHRARRVFASLLKHEVAVSLDDPSEDQLFRELKLLRLLRYCSDEEGKACQ